MKIIAVYGSSSAGKSTVSGIIARHCANKGLKTVIMSCDSTCPMMPIWVPTEKIPQSESLGNALTAKNMSVDVIAKRIQIYKPQQNIGFLAYTAEDCFIDYALDYAKVIDAIKMTRDICDVLIIDCATPLSDFTVPAAIEMADKVVCVLSPDLRSVSYYRSNINLLSAEKFRIDKQIKVLNKVKSFHATKEIADAVEGVQFAFPYDADIENAMLCGDAVNTLQYCNKAPYFDFFNALDIGRGINNDTE